jgi:acyl-[acyl-carrier-protein]-phospholipid O-acyltransferase/long-chain-fatty-acid--[acyl-carrier-protein] ligase
MFVRCLNWLVTNIFYKVNVKGLSNIPETGGALIVCNHVSYADASIILAATKRPVRFVIYKPIYEKPLVKLFAKAVQAIPVDSKGNPKETMAALKKARQIVESGELVCIFAEGGLTRVGNMLSFNKGLEKIVKSLDQPIIPACLDQLWGSVFSYSGGNVIRKWPRQIPYRLSLVFGEAMPSTSKAWEVRQKVQELAAESAISRRKDLLHLQNRFLSVARKNLFSPCISDTTGKSLNYFSTLSSSLALASKLKSEEGDMVGILLPTSVAGVVSNLGALFAGKVPVNLNYTAPSSALESAVQQCGIKTIISNGAFIEKIPGELSESSRGLVQEVSSLFEFSAVEKLKAASMALLLPSFILKRLTGFPSSPEESLATVIFSSGSTGEPKGVKLTHANIMSNIDSMYSVFQVGKKDSMIGVLPLFHAFGFTGTFWLPILSGVRSSYHPNPLEASVIGELVQKEKGTILMSTPTFLTGFLRRCKPEQLKTLRFVITGAEKLSERLARSFQKKFGVLPMEGYGASELSPVAVMNVPNFKDSRIEQTGNKPGTVGHPLPGVAVRVVGIEDGKLLAPGEDGLMLVKGPNVMEGYLNNEEKTAEVLQDGWYQTGDVARLDEDGFITITDRLSRFSKIGGEMVPHLKIEESIYQVVGSTKGENFACVVTAVPDEKKGEKLVVLSTVELDASDLKQRLSEVGLPNLWIPKQGSYIAVEEIPMLGSGKTDLKAVKGIAAKAFT